MGDDQHGPPLQLLSAATGTRHHHRHLRRSEVADQILQTGASWRPRVGKGRDVQSGARLGLYEQLDVLFADLRLYPDYDSDRLRDAIARKGAVAVIPNNPSRARQYPLDKDLYAQRHLVECCFSKLKQFRRVATRYEKTAKNYSSVVFLAATILWLK